MPSAAFEAWRDGSLQLDVVFQGLAGLGAPAGEPRPTDQLSRALLLLAAAQFQGFAKELHTETAIMFGSLAQPANDRVANAISSGLQTRRELDRANAHQGSLQSDFERFGIVLWDEMDKVDSQTPGRRDHLHWFNMARNALAHHDRAKLAKVVAAGYEIGPECLGRWRRALDELAGTLDTVMALHLARLFDVERPW